MAEERMTPRVRPHSEEAEQAVCQLACNLDDMTPEALGFRIPQIKALFEIAKL